jgi:hypothetical protein
MEPHVFGLVDNTHPSATELLDDPVMRYDLRIIVDIIFPSA